VKLAVMTHTYDEARVIQSAHEASLMRLPGVSGLMVKVTGGSPVLEVYVDPDEPVPDELLVDQIDGLTLSVQRRRYRLQ
jgi:hypothetical protein